MTLSCIHTHTVFCDGEADMETMCRAAFAKGFVSLGFSSHAPIAKKTGLATDWHMKDEDLPRYIKEGEAARKRWEGKLTIFLGLEVDYIEGRCGPEDRDFQELPLDYLIGSVHYVPSPKNGELFAVDAPGGEFKRDFASLFDNDGTALYHAYYDACTAMIESGGFDILAHLDLVKKNNGGFRFFSPEDPQYIRRLAGIADAVAAARKKSGAPVVEVNSGGMIRGRIAEPYPSPALLRLLKERNVPLVLNADAHAPGHLGGFYWEAAETVKAAGYTATVLFEGRRNGKAVWREMPCS